MRLFLTLLALLVPLVADAANDQAVKAMSKATGFTEAEIRLHGENGCESGVQLYMTMCSLYHYYERDVLLNSAYQTLMRRLKQQNARDELRTAQRAWIGYRDAQCKFETTAWEGGSARPMMNAGCLSSMTKERTKQLQEILECNDSDCPELKGE